jgi:predicted RecA/RadA family phage recombinase
MPANEAHRFFKPGQDLPCHAGAAVIGKRCVAVTANRQSGPLLAATAEGGNYVIGYPAAAGRILGVAAHDAAIGEKVTVLRGGVVPIKTAGIIAAFAEVEVADAVGQIVTKASGVALGFAMTGAASGADCEVMLYE